MIEKILHEIKEGVPYLGNGLYLTPANIEAIVLEMRQNQYSFIGEPKVTYTMFCGFLFRAYGLKELEGFPPNFIVDTVSIRSSAPSTGSFLMRVEFYDDGTVFKDRPGKEGSANLWNDYGWTSLKFSVDGNLNWTQIDFLEKIIRRNSTRSELHVQPGRS